MWMNKSGYLNFDLNRYIFGNIFNKGLNYLMFEFIIAISIACFRIGSNGN